jgi:hypothetical protein
VRGDVGSEKHAKNSSYGEKIFSNIFISIYVNLIGCRANIYE